MSDVASAQPSDGPSTSTRVTDTLKRALTQPEAGPFGLLVLALIVFSLLSATYLTAGNFSNLLMFTPELGMIALGMTLLMTAGEFDLSVGSVFGFSAVLMWTFINEAGMALEINTSGYDLRNQPFPSTDIILRARDMQIPLRAGSDAHRPEDVGRHFDKLPALLATASPS